MGDLSGTPNLLAHIHLYMVDKEHPILKVLQQII